LGAKCPNKRFNASQALYHPFIFPYSKAKMDLTRLQTYLSSSSLEKAQATPTTQFKLTSLEDIGGISATPGRSSIFAIQSATNYPDMKSDVKKNLRMSFQSML
jgi:hypothetical protein